MDKNKCKDLRNLSFQLEAVPPFRLDLTVWALRRRANNIVDRWDGKTYRRLLWLGDQAVDIAVTQPDMPEDPRINIEAACAELSSNKISTLTAIIERMLGTRRDLLEFYQLAANDEQLSSLVQRFCGLKPPRFPTIFEAMVNGIACQQITLTLGILLLNRLATNYGMSFQEENISVYAFPRPEDLAGLKSEDIRKLGFSYNKARAIIELAHMVCEGGLDMEDLETLDDESALIRLRQLRGVGRWTSEYVLLRGLGRIHLFPGDDMGARKNLQRLLKLKESIDYEDVRSILSRWEPYAGFLYFHFLLDRLAREGIFDEK